MKKIVISIIFACVIITIISCAAKQVTNNNSDNSDSDNKSNRQHDSYKDKFEYFYRGFATVNEKFVDEYPHGTYVIQTDEDWHDFMDMYVPGIPYYVSVDYSKECLVFNALFPAKPSYTHQADIKAFYISENKFKAEYFEGTTETTNEIYAQNTNEVVHCFVNIVKMSKTDVSQNIENVYHRK